MKADHQSTIERAFELARSDSSRTIEELITRLDREGFPDPAGQLSGQLTRKQLRTLMREARAHPPIPC
jgi:hypothetical protein